MTPEEVEHGQFPHAQFSNEQLGNFQTLVDIVERLRAPGGCPWDREQTHSSLKRNLLEECYEVLEAIDGNDGRALSEELGDLLVQVAFHSQIASEAGEFQLADVLTQINAKLVRRHPHVFADSKVSDAREVERNWERIKEAEKAKGGVKKSPVDGIPKDLPALSYAQLMQDRVGRVGFEWEDISGVLDKLSEEVEELRQAVTPEEKTQELGDLLLVMVNLSRWLGIHAEDALRQANQRFQDRFITMESLAAQRGLDFAQLPLAEKEELWQEAKRMERLGHKVTLEPA
jgi:tetrapyrrole methylase family protein/MazG family protein